MLRTACAKKFSFRISIFLLPERQRDNSICWQMEIEHKNKLSARQTDFPSFSKQTPPMGWDRTNTARCAGYVRLRHRAPA